MAAFTYQDWLLFCFILGTFGGTAAALAFGASTVQGCVLGAAGTVGTDKEYGAQAFFAVFRQRALETGAGWLSGLTVCSQLLFGILTFYLGMSLAVMLSVLTMQKGIVGIASFICHILPHGLVYSLIWYVLSGWSGQGQKKMHILPGSLLVLMAGAGAFLETYISPYLCSLVLGWC